MPSLAIVAAKARRSTSRIGGLVAGSSVIAVALCAHRRRRRAVRPRRRASSTRSPAIGVALVGGARDRRVTAVRRSFARRRSRDAATGVASRARVLLALIPGRRHVGSSRSLGFYVPGPDLADGRAGSAGRAARTPCTSGGHHGFDGVLIALTGLALSRALPWFRDRRLTAASSAVPRARRSPTASRTRCRTSRSSRSWKRGDDRLEASRASSCPSDSSWGWLVVLVAAASSSSLVQPRAALAERGSVSALTRGARPACGAACRRGSRGACASSSAPRPPAPRRRRPTARRSRGRRRAGGSSASRPARRPRRSQPRQRQRRQRASSCGCARRASRGASASSSAPRRAPRRALRRSRSATSSATSSSTASSASSDLGRGLLGDLPRAGRPRRLLGQTLGGDRGGSLLACRRRASRTPSRRARARRESSPSCRRASPRRRRRCPTR